MSIIQFIRILWAHRMLTVLTTVATLIGAFIAILIIPPSYQGKTRVMINTLKPDPVTGELIGNQSARTVLMTQAELIKDVGVAGQAVDQLGWLANADIIRQYNGQGGSDNDLRRAMAQRIVERTNVEIVTGTNMLEIMFRAATPDEARAMANALRDAFVESTLNGRRRDAARNADWFTQQAVKERDLLAKADAAKTDYEREVGIVMQDSQTDVETARLRALSQQPGLNAPVVAMPVPQSTASSTQLAALDAQIAQAQKTLGPNHPQMIAMKAQRGVLAKAVESEQAQARATAAAQRASSGGGAGALDAAVRQQTSRVIANRDKIEKLNELQAEVNLHRGLMEKSLQRAGEFNKEAAVADSGISVVSEAITPKEPSFPKKPLIIGGAFGLGAALGLFLSLLVELLRRRVRGGEDLESAVDAPLLAVISTQSEGRRAPKRNAFNIFTPRRARAAAA